MSRKKLNDGPDWLALRESGKDSSGPFDINRLMQQCKGDKRDAKTIADEDIRRFAKTIEILGK
ncbi:hypothetical protein [Breoghania sp. JC706]|uniref:hypothetical protein n=1 Tax=Breoghania sp. JC706 TaxID=3117732 RepID=UPI00300BF719